MNKATAEALEASIKKWERNAEIDDLSNASITGNDCVLCFAFRDKGCLGCPVSGATGYIYCETTPYEDASKAYYDGSVKRFRIAAKREVELLKSLRVKP